MGEGYGTSESSKFEKSGDLIWFWKSLSWGFGGSSSKSRSGGDLDSLNVQGKLLDEVSSFSAILFSLQLDLVLRDSRSPRFISCRRDSRPPRFPVFLRWGRLILVLRDSRSPRFPVFLRWGRQSIPPQTIPPQTIPPQTDPVYKKTISSKCSRHREHLPAPVIPNYTDFFEKKSRTFTKGYSTLCRSRRT